MQNADLRGAIFTFKTAENLDLRGTIYDQYTVFNDGFDPEKNGMIFKKSSPSDYGAKTPEQVWEMLGAEIW